MVFKDLEIGNRSAYRLEDNRSVVKINPTQEGFNAVQFPQVCLVKIDEDAPVRHYDGKVGFKQS
jgi:hypothetical protein